MDGWFKSFCICLSWAMSPLFKCSLLLVPSVRTKLACKCTVDNSSVTNYLPQTYHIMFVFVGFFNKLLTGKYCESWLSRQWRSQSPGSGAPLLKATDSLVIHYSEFSLRILCFVHAVEVLSGPKQLKLRSHNLLPSSVFSHLHWLTLAFSINFMPFSGWSRFTMTWMPARDSHPSHYVSVY